MAEKEGKNFVRDMVGSIEFRMFSPDLLKKMGVVKIISPELYDADGYPIDSSLMDLRMGVIDPGLRCRTCGSKVKECPGHFGYIELARPVLHIRYIDLIYSFLRSTCFECNRILLAEKDVERYVEKLRTAQERNDKNKIKFILKQVVKKTRYIRKCPHCEAKQKKVKLQKPTTFFIEKDKLTPVDILDRLKKIKDVDSELLGISPAAGRPDWMVLTVLPVPPVSVRPSITLESGVRSEDDLTHKLSDIVRTNQRLYENLSAGAPEIIIEDLWSLLQYHVTTFFHNSISQVPPARHRSGRPLKTLAERIKGKEGRFRKHLAGKRVNFSSRTVISPDPQIEIDEVGVPKRIAKELTIPERVTEWNIDILKEYVKKGPDEYPSANYIITPDGKRKVISDETKETILEEIKPGYIVERHLKDGDVVLFNRQPSLHRMSIMAHKVRVLPYKTFRINLCAVVQYNADFDGDEMNLHVPQTEEAIAEAEELVNIQNHLVTPRYGLPIIGCTEDQLTGNFILTKENELFTREEATDILSEIGLDEIKDKPVSKKDGVEYFNGMQLFSSILPEIDYEGNSKVCRKHENCKDSKCKYSKVIIKKGKLKEGIIDEKAIGSQAPKGKLTQAIVNRYGNEKAIRFIQRAALLGATYLKRRGFTTLLRDTDLPSDSVKEIKEVFDYANKKVDEYIEEFEKGKLKAYPGRTVKETLEFKIIETINKARNKTGRIVERHLTDDNASLIMAKSGAKGSVSNLSIMSASVGQLKLRGSRIQKGFKKRTLPHFKKGELGPASGGFVRHSYKGGLNPVEFFFNSITARDTMMDTSMRTPKSGYLQRRLINALQDIKVGYDRTVRNASGKILQFKYGGDGIDVTKSDHGKLLIPVEEIK